MTEGGTLKTSTATICQGCMAMTGCKGAGLLGGLTFYAKGAMTDNTLTDADPVCYIK